MLEDKIINIVLLDMFHVAFVNKFFSWISLSKPSTDRVVK